ncbi:hypothetical protein [Pontibacter arcticus]|uniref:Secreted protein n=1 Tax=Pontibacter arcticus TaxID=2080288 RepID=A0A364RHZ7_9BACT|nr:hypothetical protein [Pontibacter arcticus]RAU83907.1 hypothetical protein DP923_02245 [Pontibacter arcticus]
MNTIKIKAALLAVTFVAFTGLTSCNTGTEPGETNTERSDLEEEGSMTVDDPATNNNTDVTQDTLESKYYDGNDSGSAVHAGDGQGNGTNQKQ